MVQSCQEEREGPGTQKSCRGEHRREINGKTEEDLETVCGGTHKKDEHQSGRDPYVLSNPIRENEDSKQREKEEEVGRMNPIF